MFKFVSHGKIHVYIVKIKLQIKFAFDGANNHFIVLYVKFKKLLKIYEFLKFGLVLKVKLIIENYT